jgi:hypothetical protein
MKKFPIHPSNPDRICWACDIYCAVNSMACSNERSPHPSELFGQDWLEWGNSLLPANADASDPEQPGVKDR